MENFNLNNLPPHLQMQEVDPVQQAKTDAFIAVMNQKIFEDDALKYFTNVQKVELPIGLMSYLDFVEMEPTSDEKETDFVTGFEQPLTRGESVPMKTIGLQLFNQAIEQQTYQVSATITREMIEHLKSIGIDAVTQTEGVLINESKMAIWKNVLAKIDNYGEISYRKSWTDKDLKKEKRTKWIHKNLSFLEKWLPKYFKGVYQKAYVITSDMTIQEAHRRIITAILSACNMLAITTRRGAGNVAVVNGQIGTILQDIEGFVLPSEAKVSMVTGGEPYIAGTFNGITIFVDPMKRWDDNSITVSRMPKNNEPGMYLPYMGAQSLSTIAEGTMAPKIAIRLRYASVFVGQKEKADIYYTKIYFKFEKSLI